MAAAPVARDGRGRHAETPEQNVNDPLSGMRGAPAAHRLRAAHTRASRARWYCSWVVSATEPDGCSPVNEATWSTDPSSANIASTASAVGGIECEGAGRSADRVACGVEPFPIAGDDHDVGTRLTGSDRGRQPQPGAGADDDDRRPLESGEHALPLLRDSAAQPWKY